VRPEAPPVEMQREERGGGATEQGIFSLADLVEHALLGDDVIGAQLLREPRWQSIVERASGRVAAIRAEPDWPARRLAAQRS
jgi:hypothetical protein